MRIVQIKSDETRPDRGSSRSDGSSAEPKLRTRANPRTLVRFLAGASRLSIMLADPAGTGPLSADELACLPRTRILRNGIAGLSKDHTRPGGGRPCLLDWRR